MSIWKMNSAFTDFYLSEDNERVGGSDGFFSGKKLCTQSI